MKSLLEQGITFIFFQLKLNISLAKSYQVIGFSLLFEKCSIFHLKLAIFFITSEIAKLKSFVYVGIQN